jgi:hypothetical protein
MMRSEESSFHCIWVKEGVLGWIGVGGIQTSRNWWVSEGEAYGQDNPFLAPSISPKLNPVELLWMEIKRNKMRRYCRNYTDEPERELHSLVRSLGRRHSSDHTSTQATCP